MSKLVTGGTLFKLASPGSIACEHRAIQINAEPAEIRCMACGRTWDIDHALQRRPEPSNVAPMPTRRTT